MADSEEYQKLAENARDALRELLVCTEPGTGLTLHTAYSILGRMVNAADADEPIETETQRRSREEQEERRHRWNAWKQTPREERFHWVLNALGGDSLSVGEVSQVVAEQHPEVQFSDSAIRSIMTEMFYRGEIRRKAGKPNGNQKRWVYYRPGMSPQVAALAQAFDDEAVV